MNVEIDFLKVGVAAAMKCKERALASKAEERKETT